MQNHGSQDQPLNIITNSVQKLMQRTNHHSHMLRSDCLFWQRTKKWSQEKLLLRLEIQTQNAAQVFLNSKLPEQLQLEKISGRMSTVMLPLLFPNWGQQLKGKSIYSWHLSLHFRLCKIFYMKNTSPEARNVT